MCVDILHLLSVPPGVPVYEANITVYKRNQYKVVIQTRLLNQRGTSQFLFLNLVCILLHYVYISVLCFGELPTLFKLYYKSDNYNICPSVVSIVSPEIQTLGNTTTSWIIESVVPLGNDCNYTIKVTSQNDVGETNSTGTFIISNNTTQSAAMANTQSTMYISLP